MERLRVSAKIDTDEVRSDGQDEDGNKDGEGAAVCSNFTVSRFSQFCCFFGCFLASSVFSPSFRRFLRFSSFPVSLCGAVLVSEC